MSIRQKHKQAILKIVAESKYPLNADQIRWQLFDMKIEKNSLQIAKIIQQMPDEIRVANLNHGTNYYKKV